MDTVSVSISYALVASSILTAFLTVIMFLLLASAWDAVTNQWDRYGLIFIAAPLSPLLIPAIMIAREERQVLRRDETYPDFIRALGGTAQARSAEPSATIKALRGIDFGMLDRSIDRLEKRLSTRIDSDRAWDYFNADTNSAVISRYTRIYIEGSQSSGKPADTAEMVSRSVGNLLSLRRRRALSANTMRGVALGLLIASVTSLNVTIAIVLKLGDSIAGVASNFTDTDVSVLSEFGAGLALPVMKMLRACRKYPNVQDYCIDSHFVPSHGCVHNLQSIAVESYHCNGSRNNCFGLLELLRTSPRSFSKQPPRFSEFSKNHNPTRLLPYMQVPSTPRPSSTTANASTCLSVSTCSRLSTICLGLLVSPMVDAWINFGFSLGDFVEVVAMDGAPSVVDYDLEADGAMQQMQEDTETHTDLNRVIGSVGGILQALGLGLICYALLKITR